MSPAIPLHYFTAAFIAFAGTLALWALCAALASGLRRWQARRRRVLGQRVRAPEWKARRLQNGQWIVERSRERVA